MQDLQTGSLWSQILGECISGSEENKKLKQFPASHTTYGEFKKLYPDGRLLRKPELGEAGSHYDEYFANTEKLGIFGRIDDFERLAAKDKVFGLRLGDREVAVAESHLETNGWAMVTAEPAPVLVTFDASGGTAAAFDLGGLSEEIVSELSIKDDRISSANSQTIWHARTGKLIEGEGQDLNVIPTMSAFWFAWASFFPTTELIK